MRKKTKEYQTFVLEDIFSEYKRKEYIDRIKNILQKNSESDEVDKDFTKENSKTNSITLY